MIGVNIDMMFRAMEEGMFVPPPGAPPLPATPTARWHPQFSAVVENGGRVVSATDLEGLAGVTEGGAGIGPLAMIDGAGKPFWRFEGDAFLNVAAALSLDSRDMSIFMVGRVPRHPASNNRYFSIGNAAQGTQSNTLGEALGSRIVSQNAGFVQSFGKRGDQAASGAEHLVPGAQLQVIGAATAAGGTRLFLNERSGDVAVAFNRTGISGHEIGRYSWAPGGAGSWGIFDLYEMVIFAPGLSNTDAQAVSEALMAAHGVVPVDSQLVLEGDSITMGTGNVSAHLNAAAILTEPGSTHIPNNWRVLNKGFSGNQVSHLVTRRDAANSWVDQTLPGRNVMAFEIGRNDWTTGNQTAAQHYTNVVNYLNTTTTGVLQQGWEVRAMANIAGAASVQPDVIAHRAALRDPQFLTDTLSGTGQVFEGRVSVVSTDLIAHDGETRFVDITDAANTTYYAGDSTHPNILGAEIRVTGGTTPQYSVAAGL